MGCESCANGTPRGCKNNGSCGVNGCEKLHVFDWLADVSLPEGQQPFDMVEVRFKNSRKQFYRNGKNLPLQTGDPIVVEASPGFDVGTVSVCGELARIQSQKKKVKSDNYDQKKVLRKATDRDIEQWQQARMREQDTMLRSREIIRELDLKMKLSDVEFQGDQSKATFYYTADDRVDFRELIRKLAEEFKIRVEMRQIGARQEAARLGGIGSCGRELCCSTWLSDFRTVSTSAARYQQLSINPQKLAGQCGKLKCCLNYELDMYVEAVRSFPSTQTALETEKGKAVHFKTDIFRQTIWYTYEKQGGGAPVPIPVERVREIIAMNKRGKKPADLKDFQLQTLTETKEIEFMNAEGELSLTRFDSKKKRRTKKRSGGGKGKRRSGGRKPQNKKNTK